MAHAEHAPARFTADGERVDQEIVKRFSGGQSFAKDRRLLAEFVVRHRLVVRFPLVDRLDGRLQLLDEAGVRRAEDRGEFLFQPLGKPAEGVGNPLEYLLKEFHICSMLGKLRFVKRRPVSASTDSGCDRREATAGGVRGDPRGCDVPCRLQIFGDKWEKTMPVNKKNRPREPTRRSGTLRRRTMVPCLEVALRKGNCRGKRLAVDDPPTKPDEKKVGENQTRGGSSGTRRVVKCGKTTACFSAV